ncbi:hypothetical protein NX059_012375 [Plenodomus lindquistii]|nr:hypothetical protein NX059_012375 [Plenodomus lindquistii]
MGIQGAIQTYPSEALQALREGCTLMDEIKERAMKCSNQKMRKQMLKAIDNYLDILREAKAVKPLDAQAYIRMIQDPPENWSDMVVICTSKEAKSLLDRHDLRCPLLVPAAFNDAPIKRDTMTQDRFRQYLEFRTHSVDGGQIDIQDFRRGNVRKAPFTEVAATLDNTEALPINCLNLRTAGRNSMPWELHGVEAHRLLHESTEYGGSSNDKNSDPHDLSNKTDFVLLGKRGAFSFPHIDAGGVYTAIVCADGEKLWVSWNLTDLELSKWGDARQKQIRYPPDTGGFPLILRSGDLLIQPPGTVHSPLSLSNVFMQGVFTWSSRSMQRTAFCASLDTEKGETTNEDPRINLVAKLQHISKAASERQGPFPWEPEDKVRKLVSIVEEMSARHIAGMVGEEDGRGGKASKGGKDKKGGRAGSGKRKR